jgi:hypothetical protein
VLSFYFVHIRVWFGLFCFLVFFAPAAGAGDRPGDSLPLLAIPGSILRHIPSSARVTAMSQEPEMQLSATCDAGHPYIAAAGYVGSRIRGSFLMANDQIDFCVFINDTF